MVGVRKETICECVIFHNKKEMFWEKVGREEEWDGRGHSGFQAPSQKQLFSTADLSVINTQETDPRG